MFFDRKLLVTTVITILVLFPPFAVPAQGGISSVKDDDLIISDETKSVCNNTLLGIYHAVLKEKEKYPELEDFDGSALYQNKYGIYAIVYQHGVADPNEKDKRKAPYKFGITVDKIGEDTFRHPKGAFHYGFPVLGLKLSGYQKKHLLRSQYNILPLISKHGAGIAWHEQKFLPLRIYLNTGKDTYQVREPVEFMVTLKNVSRQHMLIDDLGEETLFFTFNDAVWRTRSMEKKRETGRDQSRRQESDTGRSKGPWSKPTTKGDKIILRAGEFLTMRFTGESFLTPRELEIKGVYGMKIDGVNPMGILKLRIVGRGEQDNPD